MRRTLKKNDRLHGFTVTNIRENDELHGRMVEMEHEKTGAKVVWIDNGAREKMFAIGFKTPARDDSGVFHVIEHSVLSGSEKYPVKDPFIEMEKGSMATYRNAVTTPYFTFYPIGSRYDRDLMNNIAVYLDAVFAPLLLKEENIFFKEGRHPVIDEDGTPRFDGIVLNEMRQHTYGQDAALQDSVNRALFGDAPCTRNFGGDPPVLPMLDFDQVKQAYRDHYHPSNALVYLDGSVPLDEILELTDSYFSRYDRREYPADRACPPCRLDRVETEYALEAGENPEGKDQLILCFPVEDTSPVSFTMTYITLLELTKTPDAPLCRAVRDSGLAEEVNFFQIGEYDHAAMGFRFKNYRPGSEDELAVLLRKTAADVLNEGQDKEALLAFLESSRMQLLDRDEAEDQTRCRIVMTEWAAGVDVMEQFMRGSVFDRMEEIIRGDGAGAYLERPIFFTDHSVIILRPSLTLQDEQREKEAELARSLIGAVEEKAPGTVAALNEKLDAWRDAPDDPEALASLPRMTLRDLRDQPPVSREWEIRETPVRRLFVRSPGVKLVKMFLNFSLADYTPDELSALKNWFMILRKLPTAHHTAREMSTLYAKAFPMHGLGILPVHTAEDDPDAFIPVASFMLQTTPEKLAFGFDVFRECYLQPRLDLKEEIIRQIRLRWDAARNRKTARKPFLAGDTVIASLSRESRIVDLTAGSGADAWLDRFMEDTDLGYAELVRVAGKFINESFCRARASFLISSDAEPDLSFLSDLVPEGTPIAREAVWSATEQGSYGVAGQTDSGKIGMYIDMKDCVNEFTDGTVSVLNDIITLECLWPEVRMKGGAYTVNGNLGEDGILSFTSSPNVDPLGTLSTYERLEDLLRAFCAEDRGLENHILSTLAGVDHPECSFEQAIYLNEGWIHGRTPDAAEDIRREITETTYEDILRFCDRLHEHTSRRCLAVYGNEELLSKFEGLKRIDF